MFSRILAVLIAGIAGASTAHAEPASRWVKQAASSPMDQSETVTFKRKADVLPFLADPGDPFGGTAGQQKQGGDESTGDLGGLGFREYALPIIIYAGDNYLRDPESDNAYYNGSPGGCPIDAGYSDVVSAFTGLGAYLIGISVNGTTGTPQLQELTDATCLAK